MKTSALLLIAAFVIAAAALPAATRTSANYSVSPEQVNAAGGPSASAGYANHGALGTISGVSAVAGPPVVARHGYIGQLYDLAGLQLSANPTNVNEGATRQLAANVVADDATFLPLTGSEVTWSVLNGPLTSISSSGLATAGTVYQHTPATAGGMYGTFNASLTLSIRNTGIDDYGVYASDGIDDAWQVQYFGEGNPLAFPGEDPDGDGQTNFYEYVVTSIPTNAASKFRMSIGNVLGQPDQKAIRVSPVSPERFYIMQARSAVASGLFGSLNGDVSLSGDEATFTDTNAVGPAKFYRVQISVGGP